MPNLGRVTFNVSYVVDLDNKNMVDDAKQCVFEDVMNAVKHDEVAALITVATDSTATQEDIPEFLLDYEQDNDEEASSTE